MPRSLILALVLCASCSPDPTPPAPKVAPGAADSAPPSAPATHPQASRPASDLIAFDPPAGWVKEEPTNRMRKAQYRVPSKDKASPDASLILFYFGPRNDNLQENISRWAHQMGASDPKPEVFEGKCKITFLDLTGTYTGDQELGPQENSRLLMAIVENPDGPWYFKLIGPAQTVGPWREEYVAMLKAAGTKAH